MKPTTKEYLKRYAKNLLLLFAIIFGMTLFTTIFYPKTIKGFSSIREIFTAFKLWPIIILLLLTSALPKRKN